MGVIVVGGNPPHPPYAPTLVSPANGTYMDLSGEPTFQWIYNPAQSGRTQTAWSFLVLINGGSSGQWWNATSNVFQGTPVWNSGSIQSYTFPSLSWADGNVYQWAVATQDANGYGPPSAYWTINAQAAPLVIVTAPSGTIAYCDPLVTWAPGAAPGATQTSYRVIIYTAAQYGAGGFTPGVGPSVYDSGQIGSTTQTFLDLSAVPVYLPHPVSYRVYVQVTQTGGQYSEWGYSAFATSYAGPDVPVIDAIPYQDTEYDTGVPFMLLTVTGGTFGYTQNVIITRVGSDGTTVYVRGASPNNPLPLADGGTEDYETIPGVTYTYSAFVIANEGGPNMDVISGTATADPATVVTTSWWEINPLNVGDGVNAQVIAWEPQQTEQSTAHLVMGQSVPNVVANTMGGQDGTATFETFDDPTYIGLSALLASQVTIFVSSPWGAVDSGYVRFGPQTGGLSSGTGNKVKDATLLPSVAGSGHRTTSITWVAQARPPV